MKSRQTSIVVALCFSLAAQVVSVSAAGQAKPPPRKYQLVQESVSLSETLQNYYRAPDPKAAVAALIATDQLPSTAYGQSIVAVFYFHVLRSAPEVASELIADAAQSNDLNKIMIATMAIGFWNPPQKDELIAPLLRQAGDNVAKFAGGMQPMPLVKGCRIVNPIHMDWCWATFFATGETHYVKSVADYLAYVRSEKDAVERGRELKPKLEVKDPAALRELREMMLGRAAIFSLYANADKHERVVVALEEYASEHQSFAGQGAAAIAAWARKSR